ncbi:MAG: ATP-binding protein [Bryobacteraceae bacterium]|jgi:PAS domain S-box-containing protein
MLSYLLRGSRTAVLTRAGLIIAVVAFADWRIVDPIQLGFLYLLPMLLVGGVLNRWQIAAVAALCTVLTEAFGSEQWFSETGVPRNILVFAAFFITGMFSREVARSRRLEAEHLHRIESESEARREAEEQLKVLVESSPAAILTADSDGQVLLANGAAHRLLGVGTGTLPGRSIGAYIPALVNVPSPDLRRGSFRTVMQCRGRREGGEVFLADVWFSTYRTSSGPRLAAMIVDTSEELRTREEVGLHQLLTGSRILVGAVSHEIRNVCGAIAVVHANLARGGALAGNQDFEALGTLIRGLEKIAAMELRQTANQATAVDLSSLMDELRIVIEPSFRENGIAVRWEVSDDLPPVWADRQSLMQVFLNLAKNSERALVNRARRELTVSAHVEKHRVTVRVQDTGSGVSHPDLLFRPFQQQAKVTGLGLYLSRAFMRSFRGELRYEPEAEGSTFVVELSPAPSGAENSEHAPADSNPVDRRSQPLSREPQPAAPG